MSTTALFLLLVSVKVTVALGAVAVIDLLVLRRHTSAATRHMVWSIAVIISLAMPLLAALLPPLRAPMLGERVSAAPAVPTAATFATQLDAVEATVTPAPSMPAPSA